MGYVILGLVAFNMYGVGGATFQMVAHGLISGLMFMAVGVIYNTDPHPDGLRTCPDSRTRCR